MRISPAILVAACVVAYLGAAPCAQSGFKSASADPPGTYHDQRAEDLFTRARIGISGGPGGIARLQGLRLTGHARIATAEGTMADASTEIRIQLPDKYLRIDTGTFGRRLAGYAGTTSLTRTEDADHRVVSDPNDAQTVATARFELARIMLGFATWISHEVAVKLFTQDTPVTISGPTDPLGVDAVSTDGSGFAARVIMDARTRVPARVVYSSSRGAMTMTIVERRQAGGYKLPSHITISAGDRVVDDLSFDDIAVNPKFAKTDFSK
ncbi:MAG TPA: hypothetical protein VEU08_04245 [Vicinamibacterales bacterium]|nr:hypothetical protein [Vicinamibacterales bacterium]